MYSLSDEQGEIISETNMKKEEESKKEVDRR